MFAVQLQQEVLQSLYPGCPFEREVLGLEIAQLVLSELVPLEELEAHGENQGALVKVCCSHRLSSLAVSVFLCPAAGRNWTGA